MLNPRWDRRYNPKDLRDWAQLEDTAPPVIYPFQNQILYRLLGKYYRTNGGNLLHPDNPRKSGAFFNMLSRTMEELKKQVVLKEDFDKKHHEEEWRKNQERDEDPMDKILREDDLRKDASLKKISLREQVDLGRFWISPDGKIMSPDKDIHHGEWISQHPEVLSESEDKVVRDNSGNLNAIMEHLFSDGWIRISGGIAEMSSDYQMPQLAKFLKDHTFETEHDSSIIILQHKDGKEEHENIDKIISEYGDEPILKLQASVISYRKMDSNVPNPLRENYDYSSEMGGPEWQNRVKNFEKKKETAGGKIHAENRDRKNNS
jgi:hypothetical protein